MATVSDVICCQQMFKWTAKSESTESLVSRCSNIIIIKLTLILDNHINMSWSLLLPVLIHQISTNNNENLKLHDNRSILYFSFYWLILFFSFLRFNYLKADASKKNDWSCMKRTDISFLFFSFLFYDSIFWWQFPLK